jgi:hypothetical protein
LNYFNHIHEKLAQFIKKFYFNELIKGVLLFTALGLLYLIFTLLLEHFLWLKPTARSVLFFTFISVELFLLIRYVFFPIFKLIGLKKGITEVEASQIIGNHFPEVQDKLINILQLKNLPKQSELVIAGIEQKSAELSPISFSKAVDFKKNKKYLKYALFPIFIWFFAFLTGNISVFNSSFTRVVQYKNQFERPAPFHFLIDNKSLEVIEGEAFTLKIKTVGDFSPADVKINFGNESYYLESVGEGKFQHTFSNVKNTIDFYLEANEIHSKTYTLKIIPTPVISRIKLVLNYPKYIDKKNEVINNNGNAVVPEGTEITWQVETGKTDKLTLIKENNDTAVFNRNADNYFSFSDKLSESFSYQLTTSNSQLNNYELLTYNIQVVKDEAPKIEVNSNIDSLSSGPVQFIGQLWDDYGLSKLQFVYYEKSVPDVLFTATVDIDSGVFSAFYFEFPGLLNIVEGVDYEMYFEVFDNDGVNGKKATRSRLFSYYNKTKNELQEQSLEDQKNVLENLSETIEDSKILQEELENFNIELQNKKDINFIDAKQLNNFLKQQELYQNMFEQQTEKLQQNLNQQPKLNELDEKKKELQERLQETKKMAEQNDLLEELKELTDKLNKEDLVEKLKEITKKNSQNKQSLERMLELMKRFYVEQKAAQIKDKLNELAQKQDSLTKSIENENILNDQERINNDFNNIKQELKELEQQNLDLLRPMNLPETDDETESIDNDLEDSLNELEQNKPQNAQKSQKSAAKKMRELSEKMQGAMNAAEGESINEDIDDLRKIVENLIEFSFNQEDLMIDFQSGSANSPNFPKNLKKQQTLKEYFEHIDDSLYMLSLRVVQISNLIQKEVSDVHFYIDEALLNFPENKFDLGVANQQFVVTAANNLANSLSDVLESLMNASMKMGSGKGGNQPQFSLPDIIEKQGELIEKMGEGQKQKSGQSGSEGEENSNGELFEIYKEQAELRQLLEEMLGTKMGNKGNGDDAVEEMEKLEQEILEKGFSNDVIDRMRKLQYELLKLEDAQKEQGLDSDRQSTTNFIEFQNRKIDSIRLERQFFNNTEILKRQVLPLRSVYKKKVQEYFKEID